METRLEAPAQEPRNVLGPDGEIRLAGVSRAFARRNAAPVPALAGREPARSPPARPSPSSGPSGCGKTTLLELVCGLQEPDSGTVRAAPAVLMPQRDLLLPWLTAIDNAALALRVAGASRAEARERAHPLFAAFGLEGFERARPDELSGGMRQRVAFLRTLLSGKPVLCLDEPFGALDALTRREMQEWLAGALAREPRTVLLVTHDVEEAALLADRIVVLSSRPGRVVAELPVDLPRPRAATDPDARRAPRARAGGAAGMSGAQTRLPAVPAPPEREPEARTGAGSRTRTRARAASARGDGVIARVVAPALLGLALLGIWQLYATVGSVDDFILPAPTEVAQAMWQDRALLWDNLLVTAQEVGLGVLVALVLGFGLAVALHFSITLRRGTYPLLVASQAVPIVIIAPLLVVWFGFGIVPKLAIIALVCFFPVVVTTLDALGNVDPDQIKLLRTLDASRWQAFRYAEAPAALPAALSGAKIAVAVAVIGAVFAEYAGSSSGLGHLMLQAIPQLETARAYAAVVLLAAFAVALFSALALAERRLVPWANRRPEGPRA